MICSLWFVIHTPVVYGYKQGRVYRRAGRAISPPPPLRFYLYTFIDVHVLYTFIHVHVLHVYVLYTIVHIHVLYIYLYMYVYYVMHGAMFF